jgi:hypothetical protein
MAQDHGSTNKTRKLSGLIWLLYGFFGSDVGTISTSVYYPALSEEMAMKIGGEYSSERVTRKDFEKLAEEAGLAKPIVGRRVPELAEATVAALDTIPTADPVTEKVAALIRKRCQRVLDRFRT